MSTTDPSWPRIMERLMAAAAGRVRGPLPGIVVAYDPLKRRATIQLAVREVHKGEADEDVLTVPRPLTDVPVAFDGAGGYWSSHPVGVGTTGLVMFCNAQISTWKQTGGLVDPIDKRRHAVADAVFLPGMRDARQYDELDAAPNDAWVFAVPEDGELRLGAADAAEPALLGDAFVNATDDLVDALDVFATALTGLVNATFPGASALATTLGLAIDGFKLAAAAAKSERVKVK